MSEQTEKFRQHYRSHLIPKKYSGSLHATVNLGLLLGVTALLLSQISDIKASELLVIPLIFILGGLVVWFVHRYVLHTVSKFIGYRIHTLYHHRFFTNDAVTFRDSGDFHIVFFPMGVVAGFVMFAIPSIFWLVSVAWSMNAGLLAAGSAALYFLSYEVVHFCCHLPAGARIFKVTFLKNQRQHHLIHHSPGHMDCNFGIVHPFWDYILGTAVSDDSKVVEAHHRSSKR